MTTNITDTPENRAAADALHVVVQGPVMTLKMRSAWVKPNKNYPARKAYEYLVAIRPASYTPEAIFTSPKNGNAAPVTHFKAALEANGYDYGKLKTRTLGMVNGCPLVATYLPVNPLNYSVPPTDYMVAVGFGKETIGLPGTPFAGTAPMARLNFMLAHLASNLVYSSRVQDCFTLNLESMTRLRMHHPETYQQVVDALLVRSLAVDPNHDDDDYMAWAPRPWLASPLVSLPMANSPTGTRQMRGLLNMANRLGGITA